MVKGNLCRALMMNELQGRQNARLLMIKRARHAVVEAKKARAKAFIIPNEKGRSIATHLNRKIGLAEQRLLRLL